MFGITKQIIIFDLVLLNINRRAPEYKCHHTTMYDLVMYLLKMSQEFPDGFTIALPNGHLLKIDWMFGHEVEKMPKGILIREAFGMKLSGEFGETIITVYVAKS